MRNRGDKELRVDFGHFLKIKIKIKIKRKRKKKKKKKKICELDLVEERCGYEEGEM